MTSIFKPIQPFFGYTRDPPSFRTVTKREKARRVLFEPINRQETQNFLERELAMHRSNDMSKWEFDFQKGVPLRNSSGRYMWKAVRPTTDNITMAPKRRRSTDEVDNSDLYPQPLEKRIPPVDGDDDKEAVDKNANKKQSKITDFMAVRKRQADSATSKLMTPRPMKISRQSHCS